MGRGVKRVNPVCFSTTKSKSNLGSSREEHDKGYTQWVRGCASLQNVVSLGNSFWKPPPQILSSLDSLGKNLTLSRNRLMKTTALHALPLTALRKFCVVCLLRLCGDAGSTLMALQIGSLGSSQRWLGKKKRRHTTTTAPEHHRHHRIRQIRNANLVIVSSRAYVCSLDAKGRRRACSPSSWIDATAS